MSNQTLVSIIVPVYNQEKYLGDCIESLLKQTYRELEIIIIDDCSFDNSLKIAKRYSRIDKRIIVINSEKNNGVSGARNIGLDYASGKYIAFVDPDDVVDKNYIDLLVKRIGGNDMTVCGYYEFFMNGRHYKKAVNKQEILNKNDFICKIFEPVGCKGFVWNKLFKKEVVDRYNIRFDTSKKVLEDMDFVIRYVQKIRRIIIIPDVLYGYRMRKTSVTNLNEGKRLMGAARREIDTLIREDLTAGYACKNIKTNSKYRKMLKKIYMTIKNKRYKMFD